MFDLLSGRVPRSGRALSLVLRPMRAEINARVLVPCPAGQCDIAARARTQECGTWSPVVDGIPWGGGPCSENTSMKKYKKYEWKVQKLTVKKYELL